MPRIDLSLKNFPLFPKRESTIHRLCGEVIAAIVAAIAVVGTAGILSGIAGTALLMGINMGFKRMAAGQARDDMRRARRLIRTGAPPGIWANGQLVNTRHSSDPIRIIYGIVKTGGTWAYNKPSGISNAFLNTIITWGEGEINGLGTGIDSVPIFGGTTTLNDLHTGGEFVSP